MTNSISILCKFDRRCDRIEKKTRKCDNEVETVRFSCGANLASGCILKKIKEKKIYIYIWLYSRRIRLKMDMAVAYKSEKEREKVHFRFASALLSETSAFFDRSFYSLNSFSMSLYVGQVDMKISFPHNFYIGKSPPSFNPILIDL